MKKVALLLLALTSTLIIPLCQGSEKQNAHLARMGQMLSIGLPFMFTTYYLCARLLKDREQVSGQTKVSPKVLAWARPHLEACKVKNAKLVVGKDDSLLIEAIHPNIVCVSPLTAQFLDDSLGVCEQQEKFNDQEKEEKELRDKKLKFFEFCVAHEAGHLHHGDTSWLVRGGSKLGFSLAVQLASSGISMLCKLPIVTPSTALAQAVFLGSSFASGFGKLLVGSMLNVLYVRSIEARADKFACQHITSPQVLQGAADFFAEGCIIIGVEAFLEGKPLPKKWDSWNVAQRHAYLRMVLFLVDPEHPYPSDRAKMIYQAATLLEARGA